MTKNQILVLCLLFTSMSFAQLTIKGVVKDSIGNGLEMANVIAINKLDNSLEGYSITDAKGQYKIKIAKPSDIELKVSYLGFDSQTKLLVISEKETIKDFVLYETGNNLDAVELTYEMPVTIKGDTIVYNADSFTSGNERKLGDVLEKLPGVEVNDDGEIEVEGKAVSKVMVEGKDFFDGDTKLATQNIPADAVKKIEVLKNYNEVSQMRGLGDDSDNVALNIKLKEGKKNFWFGEVTAGGGEGGNETRYLAHPKLFFFSPKRSINIITDVNNIGEIPFTYRDYFKFSGGFRNLMSRGGGINISSNSLGFSFLRNNKAAEIATRFAAANFSQSLTKSWDISGFAIYSDTDTDLITNTFITNTVNTGEVNQSISDNTEQGTALGLFKISSIYKPNSDFQLDYDVILKKSNSDELNTLNVTSDITVPNDIDSFKEEEPFSVNQNANIYYTLNEKNIFAFRGQFLHEKNNPLYNTISDEQPFPGTFNTIVAPTTSGRFNLSQNKDIVTNKLDATLDYYYIINNKSNLNFTLGSTLSNQSLNSNIYQTLDDNTINNFTDPSLINDVDFRFSDIFLGLHYKLQAGKFTLTPGLTLHQFSTKDDQFGSSIENSPTILLPDFTAKIALKNSESININYGVTTNFTDINNLAEGMLYNSFNSLSVGNRNLDNSMYQNYSIRYFNFNTFSFTNINASLSYNKRIDVIKNTSELIGIDRINTSTNSPAPEDTFTTRGSISKRFGKFKVNLSGSYNLANSIRLTTDRVTGDIIAEETESTGQTYRSSVATNFRNWPNFEIGYTTNLNEFQGNKTSTNTPFANVEIPFLKNFIFTADYRYNSFKNDSNGIENTFDFLNADLYYQQEDSPWEFKLSAINLLDVKSINEDVFSVFSRSTSNYIVQPRFLMFTVKYDL